MSERVPFRMPSLGADMEAGTVLEWHVAPGDVVRPGDLVALVDTDKAEIDIECFDGGTLEELAVHPGEKVPVGTVIAWLTTAVSAMPAAEASPAAPAAPTPPGGTSVRPAPPVAAPPLAPATAASTAAPDAARPPVHAEPRVVSPLVRHLAEAHHLDPGHLHGTGPGGRVRRADVEHPPIASRRSVSPRARRLAAETGLDPAGLTGSGPGGTVTGDDVVRATARAAVPAPAGESTDRQPTARQPSSGTGTAPSERIDVESPRAVGAGGAPDRMRRAIADLMTRSWREIPHYHLSTRADLSTALDWLTRTNEQRSVTERILPAALLLRAVAVAAARHPTVNGWWVDGAFRPADRVDLAPVVALRGGGLLAPTISAADQLPLPDLMRALRDVVARARRGRLRGSDAAPASLTVTNLGDLGVDQVFGVIHPPQVALVGVGAIHEEAWAEHGMIAVRPVVHLSLAGDHRASDGLAGAAFLADIVRCLHDPEHL